MYARAYEEGIDPKDFISRGHQVLEFWVYKCSGEKD